MASRAALVLCGICARSTFFVAPCRDYGLAARHASSAPLCGCPHLLVGEVADAGGYGDAMAALRLPEDQETAAP